MRKIEEAVMQDFIKAHGKEFIRTLTAVVAALAIAAPPAAQVSPHLWG